MDYKKVIIVGANEGILPASGHQKSFIPYHLRKGFGLPTLQEFDGIYAYHFFRLLKRSEETHLIYNNIPGENGAEKSRYLEQILLELNSPENIISEKNRSQTALANSRENKDFEIFKTPQIIERLYNMKFSASSLGLYLRCPVQFYLRYIAGIQEPETLEDTLDAGTFGNILHKTMEELYKDLLQRPLSEKDFFPLLEDYRLEQCLRIAFEQKEVNLQYNLLVGEKLLAKDVIKRTVEMLVKKDRLLLQSAPYKIEGLELEKEKTLQIRGRVVTIKGKIDRLDTVSEPIVGEYSRIIDYKTGKINPGKIENAANLDWMLMYFDREKGFTVKEGFQGCMYYYLSDAPKTKVGFYALKNLSNGIQWLNESFMLEKAHANYFEHQLKSLLEEILNPEIPFIRNLHPEAYKYSPYSVFLPL